MFYIYLITNMINGKIYVGQTNDPKHRNDQYKSAAKYDTDNGQLIVRAIQKYGYENFTFEVIATCVGQTIKDIDDLETYMIAQHDSMNLEIGYNLQPGGRRIVQTPEMKKKISESLKKHYETHDSWNKGATLTDEWKNKLSQSNIGNIGPNTGKTFSDEWLQKLSEANKLIILQKPPRFSDSEKDKIIDLFIKNKMSRSKIAEQFNCANRTITDVLVEANIDIYVNSSSAAKKFFEDRAIKFSKEEEIKICEAFINHKFGLTKFLKNYKFSKTALKTLLDRNGYDFFAQKKKEDYTKPNNLDIPKREYLFLYEITKETEKKICEDFLQDAVSLASFAEKFKITKSTLRRILKRNNIDYKLIKNRSMPLQV